MTRAWLMVMLTGALTWAIKGAGPLVFGSAGTRAGRSLPDRASGVVARIGPALFGALIVVQTFARGRELSLDARALGLGAAAMAAYLRAPPVVSLLAAVSGTALVRLLCPGGGS
jgi:hypothetical protein